MIDDRVLPTGYFSILVAFASAREDHSACTTSEAISFLNKIDMGVSLAHASSVRSRLVKDGLLISSSNDSRRYALTSKGVARLRSTADAYLHLNKLAAPVLQLSDVTIKTVGGKHG